MADQNPSVADTQATTPRQPPRFANKIVSFLLRSSFHGTIDKHLVLFTFRGRKSGKEFSAPLGYLEQGNEVLLFTDHAWWKNLLVNPDVVLHLRGKRVTGQATVEHDDKEIVERELSNYVRQRPAAARAYSVTINANGEPDQASTQAAAQRFTLIRVRVNL